MPRKICPKCQTATGPRSLVCRECGYKFFNKANKEAVAKEKQVAKYTTNGRGKKTCSRCNAIVGARLRQCSCGHIFERVPKLNVSHHTERTHWKELVKGDIISVKRGTGPYWQLKTGEVEFLGEGGIFRVTGVCQNGIHAYPVKAKHAGGHRFIYMGEYEETDIGVVHEPHHIRKVTKLNGTYAKL